jgi:hypothetical protein
MFGNLSNDGLTGLVEYLRSLDDAHTATPAGLFPIAVISTNRSATFSLLYRRCRTPT